MIIIKSIKGFIFDLDGVITDTANYHYQSWKKMTDEEDMKFNKKINEKLRGLTREKSLEVILNEQKNYKAISQSKISKLLNKKNKYYQKYIENMGDEDLLPGIKKLLNNIYKKDYKMSIASSSKNARSIIKKLGLSDFFEVISDGNSVNKNKPAPDLFLYTAQEMQIKSNNCVVIEDSQAGVKAAINANMQVVGIGPIERIGEAHYCYKNVRDIDLDKILK